MKRIPLLFIFIITLTSLSAKEKERENQIILGGVDVGNGMVIPSGFEIPTKFETEEALLEHYNKIQKAVRSGEHKTVKSLVRIGGCSDKNISVQSLHVNKVYNKTGKKKKLKGAYIGAIKLGFEKCRFPEVVRVSERTFNKN